MAYTQLVGTWALVATEWHRADGRHANPFGPGAVDVLTYGDVGNMSAQVMCAERPPAPADQPAGIETAMASVFAGYIAYFGTYEIDHARGVVVHHVIGSAFPAWIGGTHNRRAALSITRGIPSNASSPSLSLSFAPLRAVGFAVLPLASPSSVPSVAHVWIPPTWGLPSRVPQRRPYARTAHVSRLFPLEPRHCPPRGPSI